MSKKYVNKVDDILAYAVNNSKKTELDNLLEFSLPEFSYFPHLNRH